MNILVLTNYKGKPMPAKIYVHDQVKALQKAGLRVYVIAPIPYLKKHEEPSSGITEHDGVSYLLPSFLSLSNLGEYSINNQTYYRAARKAMKKLKRIGFHPDIIHAHTFSAESFAGIKLQEKLKIPCVITTHGSDLRIPLAHGKSNMITSKSLQAKGLIAVSQSLAATLQELDPRIESKVITNGFNLKEFAESTKIPHLITSCGNLVESKKFDVTLKSFAQVLTRFPKAILQIIGSGPLEEELKELALQLGIHQNVRFLGHLPNEQVLQEMNRSQIFALPSINEGFGIVYLEAMSQKCLVIATKGEGFSDLVSNQTHCLLVEPNSVESLANALIDLLDNPTKNDTIAQAGYQLAKDYSWDKNAMRTIDYFKQILANNR